MIGNKLKYILLGVMLVAIALIGVFTFDSLDGVNDILKKTVKCSSGQMSYLVYPSKGEGLIFAEKRKGFDNQIGVQKSDRSIVIHRPKSPKDQNFLLNENPDPVIVTNINSCFVDSKLSFNRYTTVEKTASSIQNCVFTKDSEDKLFPFKCN
jgi:hypothetical protein